MGWIVNTLLSAVLVAAVLWGMSRIFSGFRVRREGILAVTVIYIVIGTMVRLFAVLPAFVFNILTFNLLSGLIDLVVGALILWVTYKISANLEITETYLYFVGALAMSAARYIVGLG